METEIEIQEAIKTLAEKAKRIAPNEAMHCTQAALNLAHVLQVLRQIQSTG